MWKTFNIILLIPNIMCRERHNLSYFRWFELFNQNNLYLMLVCAGLCDCCRFGCQSCFGTHSFCFCSPKIWHLWVGYSDPLLITRLPKKTCILNRKLIYHKGLPKKVLPKSQKIFCKTSKIIFETRGFEWLEKSYPFLVGVSNWVNKKTEINCWVIEQKMQVICMCQG